jgi:hypothetical protein
MWQMLGILQGFFAAEEREGRERERRERERGEREREREATSGEESCPKYKQRVTELVNKDMMAQLAEMGFPPVRAEKGLWLTGNQSLDNALNWLAEHRDDDDIDVPLQVDAATAPPVKGVSPGVIPGMKRKDSRTVRRRDAQEFKGLFARTFSYMGSRLKTLNGYCAICDEPHAFGAMLQPSICTRPLCRFRFATFGNRIVGAKGLAAHAGILLLIWHACILLLMLRVLLRTQRCWISWSPQPPWRQIAIAQNSFLIRFLPCHGPSEEEEEEEEEEREEEEILSHKTKNLHSTQVRVKNGRVKKDKRQER